jgi:23S rRNA pseudouridine2605 synthase
LVHQTEIEKGLMRINRYLALCGFGSRRAVEDLIVGGAVKVGGEIVYDLARQIGDGEKVQVLGKPAVPPKAHEYVMLNKPKGYLCSATDPFDRPTIYRLMPEVFRKLHYVGRLDYNSRGLIMLTNDGGLTHTLLHPSREVPRTYRVWTRKPLAKKDIKTLISASKTTRWRYRSRPAKTTRKSSLRRGRTGKSAVCWKWWATGW